MSVYNFSKMNNEQNLFLSQNSYINYIIHNSILNMHNILYDIITIK